MRRVTGAAVAAVLALSISGPPAASAAPHTPALTAALIRTARTLQTEVCPATSATLNYFAPGSGRTVALTFDDGPGPSTSAILAILMRAGVRATFFNLGYRIEDYPLTTAAEPAQGHTLGNHSWDHPVFSLSTAAEQAAQMDRTTAEQYAATGTVPCLFRPPYGDHNSTTLSLAAARHMAVWNWSVDTEDWKASSASSYWVNRIITRADAGVSQTHPVILMHNSAGNPSATVAALPSIIAFYRAYGYAFVDLLGHRGFAPYSPSGAPGPAVAVTSTGLHLVTRSASGTVTERTRYHWVWGGPVSLGGSTPSAPAVARTSRTAMLVAIRGPDGHVRVKNVTATGNTAWRDIGGSFAGRPAVAADVATGTVTVVVRKSSGALAYRQRVAGAWQSWHGIGGTLRTGPAAAVAADHSLTVVAADAAGTLWARRLSRPSNGTATWSAWRLVGTGVTADPALAVTPDGSHLVLAVRTGTGAVSARLASASLATWSSWQSIGGVVASGPAVVANGTSVEVFVLGTDGRTYRNVAGSGSTATGWSGWATQPF